MLLVEFGEAWEEWKPLVEFEAALSCIRAKDVAIALSCVRVEDLDHV